jgi:hypothetical protein
MKKDGIEKAIDRERKREGGREKESVHLRKKRGFEKKMSWRG